MSLFRAAKPSCPIRSKLCLEGLPIATAARHFVNGMPLKGPFPEGSEMAMFGLGCFWGGKRRSGACPACLSRPWAIRGAARRTQPMKRSAAGGPDTPRLSALCSIPRAPLYGHAKGVLGGARSDSVYAPGGRCGHAIPFGHLHFFGGPGRASPRFQEAYQAALSASGFGEIVTEIEPAREFYFAEDYHQQYLAGESGACPSSTAARASPAKSGLAWRRRLREAAGRARCRYKR